MKYNWAHSCKRQPIGRWNKKSGMLNLVYGLLALFLALLFSTSPVWANITPEDKVLLVRQNNVRKLRLLNECIGCDLAGVTITNARLVGADLRNANLFSANLTNSDLTEVNLTGANLTGANLMGALLTNTNLSQTSLDWVNFSNAQLNSVIVTGATMQNINLMGAQLYNTPISIGGDEYPGIPIEPPIPFEETSPPVELYY